MADVNGLPIDVMEYLEYREFLRDWFQERKRVARVTSYRYLSQKTGVDAAWLVRVFHREGHLSDEAVGSFIKLCGLDARRAEYFKLLHRFSKTTSDTERRHCFDDMMRMRELESRHLIEGEYGYFSGWIPSSLRSLIGITRDTSSSEFLAKSLSPSVTESEVVHAIELLRALGLIVPDANGGWNITDRILTTGAEIPSDSLRAFHRSILHLAEESLERHPPLERDISTLTLTLSASDLPEVKERISQLRRNLLQLARNAKTADRVYALNISMFPLSVTLEPSQRDGGAPEVAS
jgi:uncharacterized protein (TIGR02147 family)